MPVEKVVVGAAVLRGSGSDVHVLAAQRDGPNALAGRWEFPGGKVEAGESEPHALRRECGEELGVEISVGERVGADVPILGSSATLRVWTARIVHGEPRPTEHRSLRWLRIAELYDVAWLPADLPVVAALEQLLSIAAHQAG